MRLGVSGLVTRHEAAELVGVRVSTVEMWESRGHLARSCYVGPNGEALYLSDDVYDCERDRRRRQPSTTSRWRHAEKEIPSEA